MKTEDNKEFWQRMAKSYAPFMKFTGQLYDEIRKRIRPNLTKDMNVLELACGSGQLSFRLAGCVRLWEAAETGRDFICADFCTWKGSWVPPESAAAGPGGIQGLFQVDGGRV